MIWHDLLISLFLTYNQTLRLSKIIIISWLCRYAIVLHKHILSLFLCFCLWSLAVYLSVFISVCCLSLCLSLSLCVSIFIYISVSLFVFVCLCIFLSLSFLISLSCTHNIIGMVYLFMYVCVCVHECFPRHDSATFFILYQLFSPFITRGVRFH